jgi:hypothetical protein
MKRSSGDRPITEADVMATIANPIYAGLGRYPAIITDAQWVDAVAKLIEEKGAKPVLKQILENLRDAFPSE